MGELKTHGYRIIKVSGSHYEMGLQYGKACRENIQWVIRENLHSLKETIPGRGFVSIDETGLKNLSLRYYPFAEEYAPELIDELRGIAEGAEVSFEDLFMFNLQLELHDLTYPRLSQQLMFGCTTFAVHGNNSADGQTIIGQNFDWGMLHQQSAIILILKPDKGPETIVFTIAGMLGCAGMNSNGVTLTINRLTAKDARPGVPFPFLVRKLLMQGNLGDAVHAVTSAHRASGSFFMIADASGDIVGLEMTAEDYEILLPKDGYLCHSNHYHTDRMLDYNMYGKQFFGDTLVRYNRMRKLLRDNKGALSLSNVKIITTNHVNYPYSICRHPEGIGPEVLKRDKDTFTRRPCNISQTIASIAVNPTLRKFICTIGPPCESEYEEIVINQNKLGGE